MATTIVVTIIVTNLSTRELMVEILRLRKNVCFVSKANATIADVLVILPKNA